MTKKLLRHFLCLGALLSLLACSTSEKSTASNTNAETRGSKDQKVSLATYESTFNPANYEEDVETIKNFPVAPKIKKEGESEKDSLVVEEETQQGFRIQIFATSSIDEANFLKATAAQRVTEDSIYVVYDPPVYKVRIGDFLTRYQASQKLPSIVSKGFTDAWVVADRVIQRKFVRVNPAELEKPRQ